MQDSICLSLVPLLPDSRPITRVKSQCHLTGDVLGLLTEERDNTLIKPQHLVRNVTVGAETVGMGKNFAESREVEPKFGYKVICKYRHSFPGYRI